MKCEKCIYHYEKKGIDSRTIYNPLLNADQKIEADKNYHMCGILSLASFLDDNRPKCKDFNEA